MALVLTAFCWMAPADAAAQPGQPDPTFGTGGKVTTSFSDLDRSAAIVVQPDGKLVVVGRAASAGAPDTGDFAIARYNANGSLDGSFGAGGKVTTDFFGFNDGAQAVALQGNGKIVVAGFASGRAALARYTVNGSLDTDFGAAGKVILTDGRFYWRPPFFDPGGGPPPPCPRVETVPVTSARSVAIQPDGKIVIGATAGDPKFEPEYIAVARYNASGSPDTTFKTPAEKRLSNPSEDCFVFADGVVLTGRESEPGLSELHYPSVFGIALQPDGRIIAAANWPGGHGKVNLVRYLPTGALDQSFGNAGIAVASGPYQTGYAMALQPDGKIVVAGAVLWNDVGVHRDSIMLKRHNSDGSLDTSFGIAGFDPPAMARTFVPNASVGAGALVIDSAGRIVVAGCLMAGGRDFFDCRFGPGSSADFVIARYSSSGHLDLTFAPGGWLDPVYGWALSLKLIDFSGFRDWATGIALQADGGIVAVGTATTDGTHEDFAVVRLLGGQAVTLRTVTPSAVGNGTMTPNTPSLVVNGESATFTLTPAAGHAITGISGTCGGTRAGNVFVTAPVTADCTVIASFAPLTTSYTVTPSAGPNGAINPSTPRSVNSGATTAFTLAPNTGFRVATVGGTCGGSLSGSVFTTASVTTNCTVIAAFSPLPTPVLTLDRASLNFAAISTGMSFISQTSPQSVRLAQTGPGTVSWTATSSHPWITVSPLSGTGPATLTIAVSFGATLPPAGVSNGTVAVSLTGASNPVGTVSVRLRTMPNGTNTAPFGVFDTPGEGSLGIAGSIPVTGWALDDLEVVSVAICRATVGAEADPRDPRCGAGQVFVGHAMQVEGARPDVAAVHTTLPFATRAGWGYMLLTNFLPNQGNGTVALYAVASDALNGRTILGPRTFSANNALSTAPFGAIDTPGQGETVSGLVNNFGWVLVPGTARADVPGGGTVTVVIDGVPIGTPYGWNNRADLTAVFPLGFSSLLSTLAVYTFDSRTLEDGVHTIAWGVVATNGQAVGVGSRYFTVANASSGSAAATVRQRQGAAQSLARAASDVERGDDLSDTPLDRTPITGRRGYDLSTAFQPFAPDASGRSMVQGEELDRIELRLKPDATATGVISGYTRAGQELRPLPIGSYLDSAAGVFTWSPGVGFVHAYDLVFVRRDGGRAIARQEVRIVLHERGGNRVGPQVVIDTPAPHRNVTQPFIVAGWAADLDSTVDTGVDTVHVWAYPLTGEAPIFVGTGEVGSARPDVAAVYGDRFERSGYGIRVDGLAPGTYDVAVFAYSTITHGFVPAKTVRVTVR